MSHTPHELAEEFPTHVDAMHKLKTEDSHFAKLFYLSLASLCAASDSV